LHQQRTAVTKLSINYFLQKLPMPQCEPKLHEVWQEGE
jgi:hypothetical protein